MSDRHLRLLRAVAKRRREDVDRHDVDEPVSRAQEQDEERAAAVTNARLTGPKPVAGGPPRTSGRAPTRSG